MITPFFKMITYALVVTSFLVPFSSIAQTSASVTNTSTTTIDFPWKSIFKRMEINFKNLSGVSAAQEDESEFEGQIDYDEALTSQMLNELAIGYKVTDYMTASVVTVWNYRPGQEEGEAFEPLDPYLMLAFDEIYEKGNFSFSTDLRVGAAVSRESKESDRIVALGSEQEIEYDFGKTPFSFEMEIFFQYNVHRADDGFDDVQVRFEPAIFYDFTDKFYSRVSYESKMYHERHEELALIDNREPTIQSGIGWKPSKKLNIYPFMDLNLREPGTKNALYGAQIDWAIL